MRPLRVLVVEDDLMIGPLLAEVLEDLGHVVAAVVVKIAEGVAERIAEFPALVDRAGRRRRAQNGQQ